MLYNQPYGISDPQAPYINGNPSTGTMGSIPPAASIEYPQREIVNFISKSALTPSNADLFQLAKAVQSGLVNNGQDTGTPNQIAITPVVPISAYHVGQRFIIKVAYGNTTQVTINVSGIGGVPLIHFDQTPVVAWELLAGQLIDVAYDGSNFQMLTGMPPVLRTTSNLYVSDAIGSDTLYDGTSATIAGGVSGPFKTIRKAVMTMAKYNLGGWNFIINVADGTYVDPACLFFPRPNGSGRVYLRGNSANPDAVQIFNTGVGGCWTAAAGGEWEVDGFSFRTTASTPGDGAGAILWQSSSYLLLRSAAFNQCVGTHIGLAAGSFCQMFGPIRINGPAPSHVAATLNGIIGNSNPPEPTLTITAAVNFPAGFARASNGGQMIETWGTINGYANVTGTKYVALGNAVVDCNGRGASYLPGNAAGILLSGGQYL